MRFVATDNNSSEYAFFSYLLVLGGVMRNGRSQENITPIHLPDYQGCCLASGRLGVSQIQYHLLAVSRSQELTKGIGS